MRVWDNSQKPSNQITPFLDFFSVRIDQISSNILFSVIAPNFLITLTAFSRLSHSLSGCYQLHFYHPCQTWGDLYTMTTFLLFFTFGQKYVLAKQFYFYKTWPGIRWHFELCTAVCSREQNFLLSNRLMMLSLFCIALLWNFLHITRVFQCLLYILLIALNTNISSSLVSLIVCYTNIPPRNRQWG